MAVAEQTPGEEAVPATTEAEDAVALAEFADGFSDAPVEVKTPEADLGPEIPAETAPEETPVVEPVVEETKPAPATLTTEQIEAMIANASSVQDVRAAIAKLRDDAFGRVGGIERLIKDIQAATPQGVQVEVTEDDMKELKEEYPGLMTPLVSGLTRVLGKMKGTKTVPSVPSLTQAEIESIADAKADAKVQAISQTMLRDQLRMQHRDWETVVGPKGSETEFRKWLKADAEKERQALTSFDPVYLADVISEFKATKKPKPAAPVDTTRSARLEEAVPVRGGGGKPPMPRKMTPEEEFASGFNEK